MLRKLFGETEEEQYHYLRPRLIALCVGVIFLLVGILFGKIYPPVGEIIGQLGILICVICFLIFGWSIMRGFLGFATVGALFSNNVVSGVVILALYIIVGYLGGIIVAVIGLCRFLLLLKKRKGSH